MPRRNRNVRGRRKQLSKKPSKRLARAYYARRKIALDKKKKQKRVGPQWRSGLEEHVGNILNSVGIKFKHEAETYEYILPSVPKKYLADFTLPNGLVLESKGRFTREDRKKMLCVLACNPQLNLLMVFSNPNQTLDKRSKTTYGQWCEDHNVPWIGVKDFEKLLREDKNAYLLQQRHKGILLKGLRTGGTEFLARIGEGTISQKH